MRTTTTAAVLLAALTLAGCNSNEQAPSTPATSPTTAPATLSKTEVTEQCIDAVADLEADPKTGGVPSEPTPPACAPLSDSEYLDAYMNGIRQGNQEGRDELQRQIDEAAKDAQ